ncbi:carbamoyl phosphate synthase small subunit [Pontibacillus halophilus JSM 076056 = DSM 19796]|uniref:Carbamoyl phosphate synthase small chain n=1 Tax=Pontibacillus halophilus JSM 076056 = DSM 19796 TaxID=1385510 RepID=A0A0A5GMC1_9BACI|nr:carbamoyl phosphate synthase small subunit [Pontibacillus halophilus]KGX92373.1 carbamoyl phosphate synthase small subunit [Pontibacillus halophilus JSM 076056 = DSM 19796]
MKEGYLLLEDGVVFPGWFPTEALEGEGEVVFNTSMTGYQEIVTDPSYAGQILVFCYPQIGNYGVNQQDKESERLFLNGVITGEQCIEPSHFRSTNTFTNYLLSNGIPTLTGVDTRVLVKHIRDHGVMKGKLLLEKPLQASTYEWKDQSSLVHDVSTTSYQHYEGDGAHVVVLDFGCKKSILHLLQQSRLKVTVVPYDTSEADIRALCPDGLVLSNGPGDPQELSFLFSTIRNLVEDYPTFGICLGHQLLGLAYGAKTRKLSFGHRGSNHPVQELETGKVWMTAQNHGYEIVPETLAGTPFHSHFVHLHDGSIEGMKHRYKPITSVQFHPEAHAGPTDTSHLFNGFTDMLQKGESSYYAIP